MRQTLAVTTLVLLLLPTLALAQTGRIAVSATAGFAIPPDGVQSVCWARGDGTTEDAAKQEALAAADAVMQALEGLSVAGLVVTRPGRASAEPYWLDASGEKRYRSSFTWTPAAAPSGYSGSVELHLSLQHQGGQAHQRMRPAWDLLTARGMPSYSSTWTWDDPGEARGQVAKQATAKAIAMAKSVAEAAGVQVRQFEYFGFAPPATVACTKTEAATPKPDERASPVPDNPGPSIMITSDHSPPRYLRPSENSASGNSATATCTVWVVATF